MNIKILLQSLMSALLLFAAAASMSTLTACSQDGPVEEAMEDAGDTAEDVGESIDKTLGTDKK